MTTIYLISDIHVGNDEVYQYKKKLIASLIEQVKADPEALVIIPGDLTDHGHGKATFLCFPCLCMNTTDGSDEVQQFIDEVYNPLKKVTKNLYISHGNHDESTDNMSYPMLDFVKKVQGADKNGFYSFQKNNLTFVCLGKYPNSAGINFFQQVITATKDEFPYVVFYHYNMEGPYSDFWTDQEKTNFKNFINDKNVSCVLHGHIHQTASTLIYTNQQKYVVAMSGAATDSFAKIVITSSNITFSQLS